LVGYLPFTVGQYDLNSQIDRHIPFGYTRKPWFDDSLSLPISCIFTEGIPPRIYLDPNLLELVKGKRVLVVDDVISSGSTMKDTLKFLEGLEMNIVCVAVGMLQGSEWREALDEGIVKKIVSAIESPLLKAVNDGWVKR
jgi:adenine/guanine phosphoribosyltransferase-like PRPP-binding protein